jgi:hypothetical protein
MGRLALQFCRGIQSTTGRIRSVAGVAGAIAVFPSFPVVSLGQMLGVDAGMTVHLFPGIGTLFVAYSAVQFDLPR